MEKPTAQSYFTAEEWDKYPPYEKARLNTKLSNYEEMKKMGFKMPLPDFVVAWGVKAKLAAAKAKEARKGPSPRKPAETGAIRKQPVTPAKSDSETQPSLEKEEREPQSIEPTEQSISAVDMLRKLILEKDPFYGFTPEDVAKSKAKVVRLQALHANVQAQYKASCDVYDALIEEYRREEARLAKEKTRRKNRKTKSSLKKKQQALQAKDQGNESPLKGDHQEIDVQIRKKDFPCQDKQGATGCRDVIEVNQEEVSDGNRCGNGALHKDQSEARYPRRERPVVNYEEAILHDADEYLFCDHCQCEHQGMCPVHGKLQFVADRQLPKGYKEPDRAVRTLPRLLAVGESSIKGAGLGVWAHVLLPKGVVFGPYEGKQTRLQAFSGKEPSGYSWIIKRANKVVGEMDAADPSKSNWMRYVNCAVYQTQQNMMSFQFQGRLYYRTVQETKAHTELMVYYGDQYARQLGIDTRAFHSGSVSLALPTVFACSNCNLGFTSPINRDRHQRLACRRRQFNEPVRTALPYLEPQTKKVPAAFEISSKLNEPGPEGKKSFKCGECRYSSDNSGNLKMHMVTHTGQRDFPCTVCNYKATTKGSLALHLKTHSGEKPFACTECSYRTTRKVDLTRHMRVHTGEKPFRCEMCEYAANRSSALARHVRSKHTMERPFACTECQFTCVTSGHLAFHKLTHTGEKKFSCQKCTYKCNQAGDMKRHVKAKHAC